MTGIVVIMLRDIIGAIFFAIIVLSIISMWILDEIRKKRKNKQ